MKAKSLFLIVLTAILFSSKSGITQTNLKPLDKIILGSDTLVLFSADMLKKVNTNIILTKILTSHIDSLNTLIIEDEEIIKVYDNLIKLGEQETSIISNGLLNEKAINKKLEKKLYIHKIKSYTFGTLLILTTLKILL